MWDERIVVAIIGAAREDLRVQKWARDFADKLKQRNITTAAIEKAVESADGIVIYRHRGLRAIGFWHEGQKLVAVWSPRRPSKWVTCFRRPESLRYLLMAEDAELLWRKR